MVDDGHGLPEGAEMEKAVALFSVPASFPLTKRSWQLALQSCCRCSRVMADLTHESVVVVALCVSPMLRTRSLLTRTKNESGH
jgi:hypothetical protein